MIRKIDEKIGRLAQIFLSRSGLYILGAGASANIVPFGRAFAEKVCNLFVRQGMFPTSAADQDARTQWIVREGISAQREARSLSGEALEFRNIHPELLHGMPNLFAFYVSLYTLAAPYREKNRAYGYSVFNHIFPSTILNYNIDGLAEQHCRPRHHVITPHGSIGEPFAHFDTPTWQFFATAGNLQVPSNGFVLFERESIDIFNRLNIDIKICSFVAIVGYTFGRNGESIDDYYSFLFVCNSLRQHAVPIFVLDPNPDLMVEMLKYELKSERVYGFPIYWDAFSYALMRSMEIGFDRLYREYNLLLDQR